MYVAYYNLVSVTGMWALQRKFLCLVPWECHFEGEWTQWGALLFISISKNMQIQEPTQLQRTPRPLREEVPVVRPLQPGGAGGAAQSQGERRQGGHEGQGMLHVWRATTAVEGSRQSLRTPVRFGGMGSVCSLQLSLFMQWIIWWCFLHLCLVEEKWKSLFIGQINIIAFQI